MAVTTPGSAGSQRPVPPGFIEEVVADGFERPTSFALLSDGRVLVAEHRGVVRLVARGRVARRPFLDLRPRVNVSLDRGLMAIASGPRFGRERHVYLYYAFEDDPRRPAAPKTMRLTRVTAGAAVAVPGSERVLLRAIPADCRCHTGGAIRFARDGSVVLSTGDGAVAGRVDRRALRAQRLDSLAGKVLRLSRFGAGLRTNPFWDGDEASVRSKIWAYGVRNPFRFSLHPQSGVPWLGDVGWHEAEEIDVAARGANLGWPCYEGRRRQPRYARLAACRALYRSGRRTVAPLLAYPRGRSASVTGGAFLTGGVPAAYRGAYVYGDFVRGWIRALPAGGRKPVAFVADGDGPVDIQSAADGSLYYLAFRAGELRRVRPTR
jgi:glucose/arabinose dehydrogenase